MPELDSRSGGHQAASGACEHDYELDRDLQMWVCAKCGTALGLTTQVARHECGPDCDRHEDISSIG